MIFHTDVKDPEMEFSIPCDVHETVWAPDTATALSNTVIPDGWSQRYDNFASGVEYVHMYDI